MNRPVLELIGREDTDNGAPWKVFDALPVRGSPSTQVDSREMRIPNGDSELEQCIRIHEMIHAKISPTTNDFKGWLSRGIASERALIIAEETRVNYLVKLLGYPIDTYLKDEREILDAALYASRSDWSNLVAGTVASVFTAAEQDWIRGSKKHSLTYPKQNFIVFGCNVFRTVKGVDLRNCLRCHFWFVTTVTIRPKFIDSINNVF